MVDILVSLKVRPLPLAVQDESSIFGVDQRLVSPKLQFLTINSIPQTIDPLILMSFFWDPVPNRFMLGVLFRLGCREGRLFQSNLCL